VISLFIGNYYFADEGVLEGLTVEGLSPGVAPKMDIDGETTNITGNTKNIIVDTSNTMGDTKKGAGDTKKTTGDSKKTTGDSKKTTGDSKKTTGDSKKTTGDSKKTIGDSKKTDDNTDIMEDFQLQYADVSNETHIRISPDKQPPMPSRNNAHGVFNHIFGMSNPNEQFLIPRI
jgi:hypothetical protein